MIWVIIQVDIGGLLDITQKMSKFGTDTQGYSSHSQSLPNPFASPVKSDVSEIPRPSFSPPHLSFPDSPVNSTCMSPNSSMTAQIGSPFIAQLSPVSGGSSYSQQSTSSIPNNFPAARSLFQVWFLSSQNHLYMSRYSDVLHVPLYNPSTKIAN